MMINYGNDDGDDNDRDDGNDNITLLPLQHDINVQV